MKKTNEQSVEQQVELNIDLTNIGPVIYADRIINFGISPSVCKLMIGQESSPLQIKATHQIVIPTEQFLEAFDHMANVIYKNNEFKQAVINGLDNLKAKLQQDQE